MEIKNLNDMSLQIGQLDNAVETDLFFGSKENPQPTEKHKGIFNMGTGKFIMPASKKYQIIQHNDVLSAVTETLGGLGLDVTGRLDNKRDSFKADLVFQDKEGVPVVDDKQQGIKLGIRLMNSYNKSCSMRLEMFGFRLVCQNGMSFGKTMGVREIQVHYGNREKTLEEIKIVTEKFIKQVIESSEKLQKYVNDMMLDSIEWGICQKILTKIITQKKHRDQIEKRIEKYANITRWEVYNAVTNYISHDTALKPSVIGHLERQSQKIMTTPFTKMEELLTVEV